MSLLKLLSVGQSFFGIRSKPSPYKMTEQTLLPKFASEESTPLEVKSKAGAAASVVVEPSREEAQPSSSSAVLDSVTTVTVTQVAAKPTQRARLSMWFSRPGNSRPAQPMVQTEMKLSTVKPVRNDLADADLEVVPRSLKVDLKKKADSASPIMGKPIHQRGLLSRLNANLLEAGRPRF